METNDSVEDETMSNLTDWVKTNVDQIVKDTVQDPEIDSWFLMNNPLTISSIVLVYLYFVLKLGPSIMKNRKPFKLKPVLFVYNLSMVIFNGYIFGVICSVFHRYPDGVPWEYLCIPFHRTEINLRSARILYNGGWYYLMSKIIELLDTVFFVLRKKQSQVSLLHVYHHSNMALSSWAYLKYVKGEQGIVVGFLNSLVHIIMYLYYFLAALGPGIQKYLWWKKYITRMQLLQFILILIYIVLLMLGDCKVHKALSAYVAFNAFTFLFLFLDFYRKSYVVGKSDKPPLNNATANHQATTATQDKKISLRFVEHVKQN